MLLDFSTFITNKRLKTDLLLVPSTCKTNLSCSANILPSKNRTSNPLDYKQRHHRTTCFHHFDISDMPCVRETFRTVYWSTWTPLTIKDNKFKLQMDSFYSSYAPCRSWTLTKYTSPWPLPEYITRQFETPGLPKRLKRDSVISSQLRKVLPSPNQEKSPIQW